MKKSLFTLLAALGMFSMNTYADDLVIKMVPESGVQIEGPGVFVENLKHIGSTTKETIIYLGEIDFGNRDVYYASSVEIAHEDSNMEGFLDFYFGHPNEGGLMFNDVAVKGTGAFQYYRVFQYNFYPETEKVPAGKGDVYVKYRECEGNIKTVTFYSQPFDDDDQGEAKDPVYSYTALLAKDATIINPEGEEARLNDEGAIGWTTEGVVAKFTGVDFKDGNTYGQIGALVSRGGTDFDCKLLLYIDNLDSEDNLIAEIWTGVDYGWNVYGVLGENLTKEVSGVHDLYVKWTSATNLKEIQLIEGNPLDFGEVPEPPVYIDVEPTKQAHEILFDGMGAYPNKAEILAFGSDNARFESSNIGYTSMGVVVKFHAVDFKEGEFKRIIVGHSSDQASLGDSSLKFYIDLPFADDEYSDMSIFDDQEILATVPAQGTADWSNVKRTSGEMTSEVKGLHDLYMLMDVTSGANIFSVYIDVDGDETSILTPALNDNMLIVSDNGIVTIVSQDIIATVELYGADGRLVNRVAVNATQTSFNANSGIYILKVTTTEGKTVTRKLVVK